MDNCHGIVHEIEHGIVTGQDLARENLGTRLNFSMKRTGCSRCEPTHVRTCWRTFGTLINIAMETSVLLWVAATVPILTETLVWVFFASDYDGQR